MVELSIVVVFALLTMLLQYSHANKSQKLVDRFSDKLLSLTSTNSFATYATMTPTAKEDEVHIQSGGNGKSNGKVFAGFPSEMAFPDHLEPI